MKIIAAVKHAIVVGLQLLGSLVLVGMLLLTIALALGLLSPAPAPPAGP